MSESGGGAAARFLGYALQTIGFLIMVLSGLCSGVAVMFMLSQPSLLPLALVFGGIPFGVGWLVWFAGRSVVPKPTFAPRHSVKDDPPTDPPSKPPTVS